MERRRFGNDTNGHVKIRKRRCSSSSSSSLVRTYRFKRAVLVRKRGGMSTPIRWKKMEAKSSPTPATEMQNFNGGKGGAAEATAVSARKLAATLWGFNGVPSPSGKTKKKSSESGSLPPNLSDPSHSLVSDRINQPRESGHRRRLSAVSQKLQLTEYNMGELESASIDDMVEIEPKARVRTPSRYISGTKNRLKDISNSLITSKELLKVMNRVRGLEDHQSSSRTIFSALKLELDRARFQVDQLIEEQRCNDNEMKHHLSQFAEEKSAWKKKEREKIREAVSFIATELEVEKKIRRQTERMNKKLGKELADTKVSLSKVVKELESEKRARDVLEQVCEELARGIGEDRAEVEELKRESANVWEEVEKEREMLQLADLLREERVQMKLSEAKYHFEEKSAVVENLKTKLEGYLRRKIGQEQEQEKEKDDDDDDDDREYGKIEELRTFLKNSGIDSCRNGIRELGEGKVEEEEENSGESDLHSIELNMEKNGRSFEWNFVANDGVQDDSRRSSVEVFKGRKSLSEKVQWGSICLNRGNLDGEDEIKKQQHRPMKGVRDQLLSTARIALANGFSSPTQKWDHSSPAEDSGRSPVSSSRI